MAKTFERTIITYVYTVGKVQRLSDGGFSVLPTREIQSDDKLSDRALKKELVPGEQILERAERSTLYRCSVEDFLKIAHVVKPDADASVTTDDSKNGKTGKPADA